MKKLDKKSPTTTTSSWLVSFLSEPGKRRGALVSLITLGTLLSAWTLSQWPARYAASATYVTSGPSPDLTQWRSPDFKRRVFGELGPFAQNHFAEEWDSINYDMVSGDKQVSLTVTAEGAEPALAQRLALAVAEAIRQESLPKQAVSDQEIDEAKKSFELAEQRLRRALAELGEMDHTAVDPFIKKTRAESRMTDDSLPMTPALATPGRQNHEEETLVEQTIDALVARRDRFIRLYTAEHPAVIALERQIAHLRTQATSGALAPKSVAQEEAEADIQLASAEELTASVEFLQDERDQAKGLWESLVARAEAGISSAPESAELTGIRYIGLDRRSAFLAALFSLCLAAFIVDYLARRRFAPKPVVE